MPVPGTGLPGRSYRRYEMPIRCRYETRKTAVPQVLPHRIGDTTMPQGPLLLRGPLGSYRIGLFPRGENRYDTRLATPSAAGSVEAELHADGAE